MIDKNKALELFQKAKESAFFLLKFRQRSEKEIYDRLKRKKFEEVIIQQTLRFLKDKEFIDDRRFARAWIESRINKPIGLRRLREELKLKGIAKEIISEQLDRIKENYSEEDIVIQVARNKFEKIKGLDPQKAKRRVYAYLLRRGFSPDVVIEAISQLQT